MIGFSFVLFWSYLTLLGLNTLLFSFQWRSGSRQGKIVSLYLWSMLLIQLASYLVAIRTQNNLYLSHLFFCTQFVLLGLFYYRVLRQAAQRRFIVYYLSVAGLLLAGQYALYPQLLFRYNLLEVFLTNYFLVFCSLMYQYNSLSRMQSDGFSVFNWAVLVYSTLSLSFFLFGNVMAEIEIDISILAWLINNSILVLFHLAVLLQWKGLSGLFTLKRRAHAQPYR